MQIPASNEIEYLKKEYPTGTLIELIHMDDPQAPPTGSIGEVLCVDSMGQLQMSWRNGGSLALIPGVDEFQKKIGKNI